MASGLSVLMFIMVSLTFVHNTNNQNEEMPSVVPLNRTRAKRYMFPDLAYFPGPCNTPTSTPLNQGPQRTGLRHASLPPA